MTLVLAHATMGFAYSTVLLRATLARSDPFLMDAAADLGATPLRTFTLVLLPTQLPALVAAWLVSFLISMDDVVISTFVTGPGASTLPMVVFSSVRLGLSPQINALAAILFAAITVVVVTAAVIATRLAPGGGSRTASWPTA